MIARRLKYRIGSYIWGKKRINKELEILFALTTECDKAVPMLDDAIGRAVAMLEDSSIMSRIDEVGRYLDLVSKHQNTLYQNTLKIEDMTNLFTHQRPEFDLPEGWFQEMVGIVDRMKHFSKQAGCEIEKAKAVYRKLLARAKPNHYRVVEA